MERTETHDDENTRNNDRVELRDVVDCAGAVAGSALLTSKPAPMVTMPADAKVSIVSAQKPDQWLASKFKGTDVLGPENEKIGNVSDILFERNGSVMAYIIGVGGFLGIGAKDVALAPHSFEVVRGRTARQISSRSR